MFEGYDVSKVDFTYYGQRMYWRDLEQIYPSNVVAYTDEEHDPPTSTSDYSMIITVWGVASSSADISGLLCYMSANRIKGAGFACTQRADYMRALV